METDRRGQAMFSQATIATFNAIAAPTTGHIEIDHMILMPTGGINNLTLNFGSDSISFALDDNQALVFDNASGSYPLVCSSATAFKVSLSAATQVSGWILYRVVGE